MKKLAHNIFNINNFNNFSSVSLDIFRYQYENNIIYQKYCNYLKTDIQKIKRIDQIPFLPVEFFKNKKVVTSDEPYNHVFVSSGTTGMISSRHYVKDINLYETSFINAFCYFYGDIEDYCILALLPSYLEREGSSLVYMVSELIRRSKNENSGFFLNNHDELFQILKNQEKKDKKTLLIGVTFALLDFAEKYKIKLNNTIIMETGGMKGRRKEITRTELHHELCTAFNIDYIHAEYSMTELLSQAYSKGNGNYFTAPWMKILIRDQYDPFTYIEKGKTGGINIIDLANIYSCSFIETKDLGKLNTDGSFEVLGRFDNSDIRGCSLLIE